jgi:hypothetical protein
MFEIQKLIDYPEIKLWKKVPIPSVVQWQLDKISTRRDQIGAYNSLANIEAQRTRIPHKVIEVK